MTYKFNFTTKPEHPVIKEQTDKLRDALDNYFMEPVDNTPQQQQPAIDWFDRLVEDLTEELTNNEYFDIEWPEPNRIILTANYKPEIKLELTIKEVPNDDS